MGKSKPYSVMTPFFSTTSGGIRVMYGLYGWLLTKGQLVFLNTQVENRDFIAIYPEIYHGNPAGAKTVVRYILAPPGEMAMSGIPGPTSFDPTDKLYSFSRFIMNLDDDHILFLPILNLYLFKDQGKTRTKSCVFVGKGQDTNVHPKEAITIDRQFAQDQQLLADFLNECHTLYCYDFRTAMMDVCRLCGVRVILITSKYSKESYGNYEPGTNGISFNGDEGVKLDVGAFRENYLNLRVIFEKKLDLFIAETQK
jgi:hypothetical protein